MAFNAAYTKFYVVGTTSSSNAGFVGAFNADGSPDGNFNPSGAHPASTFGTSGYIADDGLAEVTDIVIDKQGDLVVVATDQGAAVDGGFAGAARRFVTRRYTPAGALDMTFNAQGTTPGEIRTAVGTNDYALAVALDPRTDAIVVAGPTSVGGAMTNAGGYSVGFTGAVRYTRAGVLDSTFGTGGVFVSRELMGFPAYEHFIVQVQCDERVVLAGFTGTSCSEGACQAPAVQRLTAIGTADTTFAVADGGTSIVAVPVSNDNVVATGVVLNAAEQTVELAADESGSVILERFLP